MICDEGFTFLYEENGMHVGVNRHLFRGNINISQKFLRNTQYSIFYTLELLLAELTS